MTWSRTDRRAAKFERKPSQQLFAVQCPHQLAVFQDANAGRPRNTRLARAALPCLLRPGHAGAHKTHGDREWT